jgi:hypothetical protein
MRVPFPATSSPIFVVCVVMKGPKEGMLFKLVWMLGNPVFLGDHKVCGQNECISF